MPRGIIQLELVCHAAGTLVCYWFLLSFFFFIKSISISLAQKLLSVCAQLPKRRDISILPIEECQALGHKIIDLAQQSDELGLSLSWNEDSFFILKMAFIDPTFVRQLYLLLLGILWDIMNKASIALSLLKKKRNMFFLPAQQWCCLCLTCGPYEWQQGDMPALGASEDESFGKNRDETVSSVLNSKWKWFRQKLILFSSVAQSCPTPWTAARQASLSITNSESLLKLMSIESVMPSNHLILCCPLLLLPSIFLSIRVFSSESVLGIRWPKYWSFSFSISPSNEYSGLISFRLDWFNLAVHGTLKSLLQHHSSKASVFQCSAFFMVQLSHPYITTGKTIALTRQTFVSKVMSLLFNTLSRFVIACK